MLALLERMIGEVGGTYACADTDAMAIVASREGGLIPCPGGRDRTAAGQEAIRALSFADVEEIRDRFRPLNPYGSDAVPGSILELEKENFGPDGQRRQVYCFAVSAKRYALYVLEDGEPSIVKPSQHALGYLLDPLGAEAEDRDWTEELWQREVRRAVGLATEEPDWFPHPALGRLTAAKPATLEAFAALNEGRPYAEQIKPHNFMLVAQTAPFGHPSGVQPQRFQAIAPWSSDPGEHLALPWIDKATGKPVKITTDGPTGGAGVARVKTFGELARAYGVHPEPKSLGADGKPCGRGTVGLLGRRPVIATRIVHIGKESNELEELEAGAVHDSGEVLLQYVSPRWDPWERIVRPTLRAFGARVVAERSGMSLSAVKEQLAGRSRPHAGNERKLWRVAGELAGEKLCEWGVEAPRDALDSCAAYFLLRGTR
jgi:hypothetical protein